MSEKDSDPKDVIDSYRRRQQTAKRAPLLLVVAAVLLIVGAAVVIFWLFSPEIPGLALFASETPTPTTTSTVTPTVTSSVTPTVTPTETAVPTETLTPTPSGPFVYEVVEGDSCFSIADQFDVGILVLISINNLDPTCPIQVGDKLTIPGPDTELPTPTPFPDDLPRGTKIEYMVQFGDSLAAIAIKFNSTVEAIKEENEIENENEIFVGQVLIIPVNLVTPVPTNTPGNETQTPTPGG